MKRFLLLIILVSLNMYSFAQKTNSRGEYLVKSIKYSSSTNGMNKELFEFKYDSNDKLIEIKRHFNYQWKYKSIEIFTTVNNRYQFISYVNGKQVLNSKCQFTFNKKGYINKLYIYNLGGSRVATVGTFEYDTNGNMIINELSSEEKGGNNYKFYEKDLYTWDDGNVKKIKMMGEYARTNIEYTTIENNININIANILMPFVTNYKEHIIFATEWCGLHNKNLVSYYSSERYNMEYVFDGDILKKAYRKCENKIERTIDIEYVY